MSDLGSPLSPDKPGSKKLTKSTADKQTVNQSPQKGKEEEVKEGKKPRNPKLVKIEKFIDHWAVTTFMTIITVYALFGDDIRLLAF